MKKLILLTVLITILSISCVKNNIVCTLEVEYCDGKIDTVEYKGYIEPRISTYKQAVPLIDGNAGWNGRSQTKIINVCKFRKL